MYLFYLQLLYALRVDKCTFKLFVIEVLDCYYQRGLKGCDNKNVGATLSNVAVSVDLLYFEKHTFVTKTETVCMTISNSVFF